jgi:DNA-dependent protein kinase catalytic subunit
MIKNYNSMQKGTISMLRQYRVGEIPDIQIDFKDIIVPLMALAIKDSTIATEILVELFTEIYKESKDIELRKRLGQGISGILT